MLVLKSDTGGKMSLSKKTVDYVAHLARIDLKPKELEKLSGQLKGIIDFIGRLKKADVSKVDPTSHILPISNVLREDEPQDSLSSTQALENAPELRENFYVVPKIIE
ncbi:Asp-tRNA(Asn)/Glu-tRNA(Gln) amidotransferase subunit GatC [Candidatus Omnitrophota bacterium]